MDIQKEREAFLKWHYQAYLLENPEIDVKNAQYIYDYAHKNVLCAQLRESHFNVWQAAKAQAIPDGFVLNKPAKVGSGTFGIGVKWSIVIGAAQRQFEYTQNDVGEKANIQNLKGILFDVPEGFVLVPKEPTQKMLNAGHVVMNPIKGSLVQAGTNQKRRDCYKAMIEAAQEQANESE